MTVHLAGSLPKSDLNGFSTAERRLVSERQAAKRYLVVGVFETVGAKEQAPDWSPQPVMQFSHVELVDEKHADEVAKLLVTLYQERTGRVGLDIPEATDDQKAGDRLPDPEPLQLEAATELYSFLLETIAGGFSITLVTPTGALAGGSMRAKLRDHKGVEFGQFYLGNLPESLQPVAQSMVDAWETNQPVDADVVDEEPPSDEDAPVDPSEEPEGQE